MSNNGAAQGDSSAAAPEVNFAFGPSSKAMAEVVDARKESLLPIEAGMAVGMGRTGTQADYVHSNLKAPPAENKGAAEVLKPMMIAGLVSNSDTNYDPSKKMSGYSPNAIAAANKRVFGTAA